jgi:hypothetical protein
MAVGLRSLRVLAFLALTGVFVVLALGEPASAAAASCRQQVIDDWSADGRVDRVYPLECYHAAIGSLPPDIRDYTDATDSIERALTLAVRAKRGTPEPSAPRTPAVATSASGEIPLSLMGVAGLAAALLTAGALGYTSRRAAKSERGASR